MNTCIASALTVAAALSASLAAPGPAQAVENDLWGFAPTAQGGQAQTCSLVDPSVGEDSPRICAVVYCDADGAFWIAQRFGADAPAPAAEDAEHSGAIVFGETETATVWSQGAGPAEDETLWRTPVFDLDAFRTDFAEAGGMTLSIGHGDAAVTQDFTVAASNIALALLELRCRPRQQG